MSDLTKSDWQIAVSSTDTVWGIVAKLAPENLERIYQLKQRDRDKPLIVFVDSIDNARRLCASWDDALESLVSEYWPGALTLVTQRSALVPDWINRGVDTIGIRIPDSISIRKLLRETKDGLLLSTSANISGQEPINNYDEALKSFSGLVDLILEPGDESPSQLASTVVQYDNQELMVVREGEVKLAVDKLHNIRSVRY